MTRIVDDDPPIKSKTNQAYRDNWDRVFGEEKTADEPTTFKVSQPPRVDNCPSNECAIRNLCIGHGSCPYIRDANYEVVGVRTNPKERLSD